MEPTVRELFIYYRCEEHQGTRVLQLVGEFQAQLTLQWPALNARLLRRPELHMGRITWMETYSMDDARRHPQGVDVAMQSLIEEAARVLLGVIDGPRHVEVFEPCAW
jgi:Domain of unknown function (DUF4936)